MIRRPEVGECWAHVEGGHYRVVALGSVRGSDGRWAPAVTYQSTVDGRVYTRELDSFVARFHRSRPRPTLRSRSRGHSVCRAMMWRTSS